MNKFLKLFKLQKIPNKSIQDIERQECDHEWSIVYEDEFQAGIYCPKCKAEKWIKSYLSGSYINMSQLRKNYLESQKFDALDERIKQLEMEANK